MAVVNNDISAVPTPVRGAPIFAKHQAAILDVVKRVANTNLGTNAFVGSSGVLQRRGPQAQGSGQLSFARITDRVNASPPYIYSGEEVVLSGTSWVSAEDPEDLTWKLYNAYEQDGSGVSGAPVENGAIVMYSECGDGFVFERSPYKGTYS